MDNTKAIWKQALKLVTRPAVLRIMGRRFSRLLRQLRLAYEESQRQYQSLRSSHRRLAVTVQKYTTIFEQLPHPVLLLDLDGNILEANGAALDLLGMSQCEILHKPLVGVIVPLDGPAFQQRWAAMPAGGSDVVKAVMAGNSSVVVSLALTSIWDPSGDVYRLLVTVGSSPAPAAVVAEDAPALAAAADRFALVDRYGMIQRSSSEESYPVGQPIFRVVSPEEGGLLRHALASAERSRLPQSYDFPLLADGDTQVTRGWVHRIAPLFNRTQIMTGFIVADMEISASLRQEFQGICAKRRIFPVLEAIPAFVYLQSKDKIITYGNSAFRRIFGEVVGQSCAVVFKKMGHVCDGGCNGAELFAMGQGQQWQLNANNGRTYMVYDTLFQEANWEPLMLGVGMEITTRILAEEALARSEHLFHALASMVPVGIFRTDAAGRWVFVNPRWEEITGWPIEQAMGLAWQDVIHLEDRPRLLAEWREAFIHIRSLQAEFRLSRADGTVAWVLCQATPNQDETDGFVGMVGTIADMSERRLMEEALGESERRYRAIVEDQTELICRFHPEGGLTFVNEAYCRYFDLPREGVLGRHFLHYLDEDKQGHTLAKLAVLTKRSPVTDMEHYSGMGGARWQKWTYRAIFNPAGQLVEFQAVGRDITEDKKIQDAILRLKDELELQERRRLAATLHDGVGQSMQAINLGLKLVAATLASTPHEAQKTLREMSREVLDTIAQLRDISGELRPSFLERMELVDAMRWWGGRVAERSRVAVHIQQPNELPRLGLRVKYNCFQIFQEALSNAIKHSGAKDVVITVEGMPGDLFCMEIADKGKGFNTHQEIGLSQGLGLSIIPERVARMGGTLQVTSEPGSGTSIHVTVPCREPDGAEKVPTQSAEN